jgi:hypothetical protein
VKVIEVILVIFLVSVAIYNFEFYDFNKWLVSILLLLSAAGLIFKNSEFSSFVRKTSLIIVVFLVVKIVFFD